MTEQKDAEILEEKKDEKKKNVLEKVKDAILPDQEELGGKIGIPFML